MLRRSMMLAVPLLWFATQLPVRAQESDTLALDPGVVSAGGSELVRRAPDASIDRLFQALQASAQLPDESRALCGLFEPGADRSLAGLGLVVAQLGDASRERIAGALAEVLVAGSQYPLQPYDRTAAQQSLKAAGVTAAFLHDGFVAGLNGEGSESAVRDARCQSLRWLLEAVHAQPLAERASVTRYLLTEGLARLTIE